MVMLPARFLGLLNQQELIINQINSGKALLGSLLQQGGAEQVTRSLVHCAVGAQTGFIYVITLEVCPGIRPAGVTQVVYPPLWWQCLQGACIQCPNLAPSSSEVAVRFLCIFCPEFTPVVCAQLFLVSYSFFCILLLEEICVSRCQHCSIGPRPSLFQFRCHLGHRYYLRSVCCGHGDLNRWFSTLEPLELKSD